MKSRLSRQTILFSFVCLLIGFLASTLFHAHQDPESSRDTRDTWEVRTSLLEEQEIQQKLYKEIAEEEQVLNEYQSQSEHQQVVLLKETIAQLQEEAGLTEQTGMGVEITLEPMFLDEEDQSYPQLTAELLQHLINQLNAAGATDMAVQDQRIINLSPVRGVNGGIYINNGSIGDLPYTLRVLAEDSDHLIRQIESDEVNDYFALENVAIHITEPQRVTLPSYDDPIDLTGIHTMDQEEAEEE